MAITIQERRATEFRATRETKTVLVPRSLTNAEFHEIMGLKTTTLFSGPDGDTLQYAAFPMTPAYLIGGKIIGVYSDGPAHGDSDRQIMFRIDDPANFSRGDIRQVNFRVSGSAVFDTSLLDDLMADGDRHVIKRFLISKAAGIITVTVLPLVTNDGLTFSPWSRPKQLSDGHWYRAGYQTNTSNSQTVLLKSTDNKATWSFVSFMASNEALRFTEADIVETSPGKLVALVREDTTDGRPLYQTESDDLGLTWSTPVLQTEKLLGGVQPNANTLADGTHLWMFGDRSGPSGSSNVGMPRPFGDCTGITAALMRTNTILSGTYSGGLGTIITGSAHNIAVGNIVKPRLNAPSGWNGTFVAWKGTSGSTLVVKMSDPGGSISQAGELISWGWLTQVATFVGTDGGQPMPLEISPGKIVAPFYGVRRFGEKPRIQIWRGDKAAL